MTHTVTFYLEEPLDENEINRIRSIYGDYFYIWFEDDSSMSVRWKGKRHRRGRGEIDFRHNMMVQLTNNLKELGVF